MKKIAIILAGGEGHRAGGDMPKQFREVGGFPMYQWSLRTFREAAPDAEIMLVCHPGAFDLLDILEDEAGPSRRVPFTLICGGRSRRESVANALMEIAPDSGTLVAVHDSARPLVSVDMVRRGWECAEANGSACPVVPVADSLRRRLPCGGTEAVTRADYMAVQTPQIFRADILKNAYAGPDSPQYTDDASIVQGAGYDVTLYEGDARNFKVTLPGDFIVADALLRNRDR